MKTLLIAEHDGAILKPATYHTLSAAKKLNHPIDVMIVGHQLDAVKKETQRLPDIQTVLIADHPDYAHQLAENVSALIADSAKNYDYVLVSAGTFGKDILPRLAALLDVTMLSDVMQIVNADTFVRPIYAGNIMATVQSHDRIKVMTIRTTHFEAVNHKAEQDASVTVISTVIPLVNTTFENQALTQSSRPELTSARVVISGGRGLKSADNFHLLEEVADRLGAALGASRAAVDAGFAPNDYQVGQTGKVVAPDLYIAVGISGAIQHLAGMKDSKVIVAINNDPDAPIFQIADYALVGDLFKILPELKNELDKVISA